MLIHTIFGEKRNSVQISNMANSKNDRYILSFTSDQPKMEAQNKDTLLFINIKVEKSLLFAIYLPNWIVPSTKIMAFDTN